MCSPFCLFYDVFLISFGFMYCMFYFNIHLYICIVNYNYTIVYNLFILCYFKQQTYYIRLFQEIKKYINVYSENFLIF